MYPTWEGYGVCDNPVSHSYSRGIPPGTIACDDYTVKPENLDPICSDCHYWLPVDYLKDLGECSNPKSPNRKQPIWADRTSGTCFTERSFEGMQLLWCQTCHLTISSADLPNHPNCRLFVGAAQLPVEDMMELTLAGD
jgi:hypothetical protein